MRRITAIEDQARNPNRVNIHLDGEFAFSLDRLVAGWLRVGQDLDETRIAGLKAKDDGEKAWQKALHFLSFRPRSAREIRQHLLKREIPTELVEETLVRLEKSGLVNDQDFARLWVENRSEFHPRSRRMLAMELRRKGVNDETIQPALESLDEGDLALEAARRHAHRLAGKPRPEFLQKLAGFLQRRGFSYDVVSPVVSKVWRELQTADTGGSLEKKDEIWDKT